MGVTDKYEFPWPSPSAFLRAGSTAIRSLAEALEAALLPPLLVTDGSGSTAWSSKVSEVGWDVTDDPDRKRGGWDSTGADDQLVIPSTPGYYQVATSVRFGGKSEPDWYDLQVRTRQVGDSIGDGNIWGRTRVEQPANPTSFTQLGLSTIVRVADTSPRTGIAVRLEFAGDDDPPDVGDDVNKLRIIYLSAL